MYRFWVYLHIAGVFGFLMAHGVSVAVALKLRGERDPGRVTALLELSSTSLGGLYLSLLVLLTGGVVAGFQGSWWGRGWIWTSIGILVGLIISMYAMASPFYNRVREAAGAQTYKQKKEGIEPGAANPEELDRVLSSTRPFLLLAIGVGGLLAILYLMLYKPF